MKAPAVRPDDLRWTIVGLALTLAPIAPYLASWVPALAAVLGLWRWQIARRGSPLPRLWLLLPTTLFCAAGILASYKGLFGRDASIALLALMLGLKLLESSTRRDLVLLIFLGYFISLTSFLFSQSLLFGAYMGLPLLALTAALVGISHPGGGLPASLRLRLAGRMLAQAAPVMLAMFLLFPRVPGPLWGVPQDATRGMTGLSDDMSPGSISQLSRSDAVAFRAEFDGPIPGQAERYWRGPVLWHYDGRSWRPGAQSARLPMETLDQTARPARYTVTLEPHNRLWLFMLDLPGRTPPNGVLTHDYQLLARQPVRHRIRYPGLSHLQYRLHGELDAASRDLALQLPRDGNPRARALGQEWAGMPHGNIVQRALAMYRQQPFVYTLSPPLLGEDSVDAFLFSTRRGFCEHYAGSFVFLMRAAGVPARVVTGYQGGEINPVGQYLIVRQSDAHAWAEVWLAGRGWVRVDPTAAVSPQRVEAGMAAALPAGEPVPTLMRGEYALLRKLYLNWDALNNGWNQWVLGYNQQRQMELLSRLAGSRVSWRDMAIGLMIGVGVIVGAIAAVMLRSSVPRPTALQRAWLHYCRTLARAGLPRRNQEGPLDYAQRAAAAFPTQAEQLLAIGSEYARLRYSGVAVEAAAVAALRERIRKLKL